MSGNGRNEMPPGGAPGDGRPHRQPPPGWDRSDGYGNADPYGRRNDPYGRQPNDPYGGQPNDPYGGQPNDPYGQPNGPYGGQPNDPYGGQRNDPYGGQRDDELFGGQRDERSGYPGPGTGGFLGRQGPPVEPRRDDPYGRSRYEHPGYDPVPPGGGDSGRGGSDSASGPASGGGGRRRAVRRRSLSTLIGPLAGAIGLAILLGAGVYALAGSRGCSGGAIKLNVATAPEIAPAVNDIASSFNKDKHSVDGKCVQARVKASDPAAMSTVLSGGGSVPGEINPDVWIPDSSLWVTLVRSTDNGAGKVRMTPTSVAKTPIVVATSRAFATKIRNQGLRPTWDMLLKATDALSAGAVSKNDMLPANSVHLQILDPNRSAGGIGAVVMTHMLLQGDPNADPIFTQIVRTVQNSLSPTPQALFASFNRDLHGRAPVVIVPEQAVWKYNQGGPRTPAAALYPSEGLLSLDYPYTLTTEDDTKVRAANLLEQAMSTTRAGNAVRTLGFRTPDGHPGNGFSSASGLSPKIPRALPTPGAGDVTDVMQAWTKLSLRSRILTLLDVSGSMSQPVGKGLTRMQATAQVAQGGLALLPDSTDLGLWTFSTHLNGPLDYRIDVPLGPLSTRLGSGTRRQAVLSALGRLRPKPNGDTGLYDSVLAATRSLQRTYKPGYYNTLLVLTDGKNDDDHGVSLGKLLTTLKRENDPNRPVQVVFIGFGPDVDMAAMQKIALQTNGEAYQAMKPQDVQRILLETIARRICAPQCH